VIARDGKPIVGLAPVQGLAPTNRRLGLWDEAGVALSEDMVLVRTSSWPARSAKRERDAILSRRPVYLEEAVRRLGFEWMDPRPAHAVMAGRLPRLHGDPFDRMLAAQALIQNATRVTRDPGDAAYGPVFAG